MVLSRLQPGCDLLPDLCALSNVLTQNLTGRTAYNDQAAPGQLRLSQQLLHGLTGLFFYILIHGIVSLPGLAD